MAVRGRLTVRRTGTLASVTLAMVFAACSGLPPSAPPSTSASSPGASTEAVASGTPEPTVSPAPKPTGSPTSVASGPFPILGTAKPVGFNPTISCTGTIGASDPVALVALHAAAGSNGSIVLRDYADPNKPRTACALGNTAFAVVQLIDARHLVISADSGTYAVVDVPEVRFRWFRLPASTGVFGTELVAVSPALDRIVWKAVRPGNAPNDIIHVATVTGDRIVATLPDTNAGRCLAATDSNQSGYTRSGSALFVLDEPLPEISLIVLEGDAVGLSDVAPKGSPDPATRPLMALWSPTSETLYFKKSGAVWRWTLSGGTTQFLAGVDWSSATISPDGAHLAYAVRRSDGLHDVYLVDLAHGGRPVRIGKGPRDRPVFLNSSQLWFLPQGSTDCVGQAPAGPLVYNVGNGTESPSIIDNVFRVWPATSTHA